MLSAADLQERGLEATNSGHHARARTLLLRALDLGPEPETRARVLVSLAYVEWELGSTVRGLQMCDEALATEGASKDALGLARSQRALLLTRAGQVESALAEYDLALGLLDHDQTVARARLHLNRGMVHLQRRDAQKAIVDFEESVRYGEAADLDVPLAKARFNLGYSYLLSGELVEALRLMEGAKPVLDPLSPTTRAINEQDRAEVLLAAGMTRDAADGLRRSVQAFGKRGLRQRQGEAEYVLSRLLLLEDPAESWRVARRAQRRFEGHGTVTWALRAEAISVAAAILRGRGVPTSVGRARELAEDLRTRGLETDGDWIELYALRGLVRSDQDSEARDSLGSLRPRNRWPLAHRILAREIRSELAVHQGRKADALTHVRAGLSELHDWQSSFGSLDLQSTLVGHGRNLAVLGMSIAVRDGRPSVVFEWAERARALAGRVSPVRPPADPAAARDLAALRRLQSEIAAEESNGRVPVQLRDAADELRTAIRQRTWYDRGSGLVTEPETLDAVQATLDDDEVIACILAVDGRLHALVVAPAAAELVDLGPLSLVRGLLEGMHADLDMAAAHLPTALRAAVHAGLGQRLVELSRLLVRPWSRHVRDRRVVVVPSGSLAGTPWTLLPDLAGVPITVPRSASDWAGKRDAATSSRTAGFVAGPHVDRAREEVKRSAHAWSAAEVLAGDDVRASAVHDLASRVDVFHVAAHGRHSADNPLFSGLELVDGPWFGYDIDQVESIPSTVILSACELGRSTVRWGEETIGMTVAWLHAGARTVIASPANVDDDVACEVLAHTHQRLSAGTAPAEALAGAMARAEGGVAPFICFGSGW